IPLNVHSYYSFLDSTLSIKAIVELARRHQLPAIAITDKHNLHGAVEFAQTAMEAGIKPIIGAELDWQGHRLCLYAQNATGYHNLCRVLSRIPGRFPPDREQFLKVARGRRSFSPHTRPLPEGEGQGEGEMINLSSTDGLLAVSPAAELAQFFPDRF